MTTETSIPTSEGEKTATGRDGNVKWYSEDISQRLQPSARELLEKYSKIPPDEVESHVYTISIQDYHISNTNEYMDIFNPLTQPFKNFWSQNSTLPRDQAWSIQPYPCIGQFRFLDLSMIQSPHYPAILSRLKTGKETFLDLGCCFGQEIRKLVFDGVPSSQLYGCDLRPSYFDCGYDLFRDRETLKATFFQADIFDPESDLNQLDGKIDILYVGSFLHLFGYSQQVEVCVRITELLGDKEGCMVVGRQTGHEKAGEFDSHMVGKKFMRHDVESFGKMWEEVGRLTGTKWRVEAELKPRKDIAESESYGPLQTKLILRFAVFREAVDELE